MHLTDNEAIWLWNVTDTCQPRSGLEIDIVAGIRIKLRTQVEDITKKRAQEQAEAAEPCATGC